MDNLSLWEIVEIEKLKRFFHHFAVDCVFDVGANRGQYRDLLRKHVGFQGPILSYEPLPHAAGEMIRRSVEDDKWFIEQLALGRSSGKAQLNVMANDKFSSLKSPTVSDFSKLSDANKIRDVIDIEVSTISIELNKYSRVLDFARPFLKMDTQGNDVDVVEGAGHDILKFVGIQSELSVKKLYDNTLYFHESIEYLRSKGFALNALFDNTAGHFPDLVEMDCIVYRQEE